MALLGINAKLYYNTGSNYSSPTWTEVPNVTGLALPTNWNITKFSTRESLAERGAKTTFAPEVTGRIKQHFTNTIFLAFWAAHIDNEATMDFLVLNHLNNTNGARGYRFEAQVAFDNDDQGDQAVLFNDFRLVPADTDNAFATAVVTSGSPVFTAM